MTTPIRENLDERELTPNQRVALLVWCLANGEGLRVEDMQAVTGLRKSRVYTILQELSCVLPIVVDEEHVWQRMEMREGAD